MKSTSEYRKRQRNHVWGSDRKVMDFGKLGTLCNVAKEFDGFMIPDVEQLVVLANTVAGKNSVTPPQSPDVLAKRSRSADHVGESDHLDNGAQAKYFRYQQEQTRAIHGTRTKKVSASMYSRVNYTSSAQPLTDYSRSDGDNMALRTSGRASAPQLYSQYELTGGRGYGYQNQAAISKLDKRREREMIAAAVSEKNKQNASAVAAGRSARSGVVTVPRNVDDAEGIESNVNPVLSASSSIADTTSKSKNAFDANSLHQDEYEMRVSEKMMEDRKRLLLAHLLFKYISLQFSVDKNILQSFVERVKQCYSDLHYIVYLLGEALEHFRTAHITHTGLMNLVAAIFRDAPSLALEFAELAVEKNAIKLSDPSSPLELSTDEECLTLRSNLSSDLCFQQHRQARLSADMCYAFLGQQHTSHSVEHFLGKLWSNKSLDFRKFTELVTEAKRAFSMQRYVELMVLVGRIHRILPAQYHYEFDIFFPIFEAYRIYPGVRFEEINKQQQILPVEVQDASAIRPPLHSAVLAELMAKQKQSSADLDARLLALVKGNAALAARLHSNVAPGIRVNAMAPITIVRPPLGPTVPNQGPQAV